MDTLTTSMVDTYCVVPQVAISKEQLTEYWGALANADTLKFRWSDLKDPTVCKVLVRTDMDAYAYGVLDMETGNMVAEFSLENFTGKAAQIHFSMHPGNDSQVSLQLCEQVGDAVLQNWTEIGDLNEAYLDTLFGVTPVKNRVACIFIQKAGMKKLGILPSGSKYLGDVCDALITVKTRN